MSTDKKMPVLEPESPLLRAGGALGARLRNLDWAASPLGAPDSWPITLQITLTNLLANPIPQLLWWGPTRLLFWNDAFQEWTGSAPPGAPGEPAVHSNSGLWSRLLRHVEGVFVEGESDWAHGVVLHAARSGAEHRKRFNLAFSPVYDVDEPGVVSGVLGTLDAGHDRGDEQDRPALNDLAEEVGAIGLDAIVAQLPVGVGLADAAGRTLTLNPAGLRLHGFDSLEDMLVHLDQYREQFELRYPDDRPLPPEDWPLARAMRGEYVRDFEVCLRRPDGEERVVSYSAVPIGASRDVPEQVVFVLLDVTERRQAERELRERERQLGLVIDSAPAFIAHLDLEGRFRLINRTLADQLEVEPAAVAGKHLRQVLGTERFELIRPFMADALRGDPVEFELEAELPAPGRRFLHARFAPEVNNRGEVSGFVAVVNDVTERREADETLKRQLQQLHTLYQLSAAVSRAPALDKISDVALDSLFAALDPDRASVLMFEADGVMRFQAWRGLSADYRRMAEGHTPWKPYDADAEPIAVPDVRTEPSLASLRDTILAEGIRALSFIPLVAGGRVLGKFMVYYDRPHDFTDDELQLCRTIAGHVAYAIERTQAETALRESEERFRLATGAGKVGVWDWDITTNRVTWSDIVYQIHGLERESFGGSVEAFVKLIHPSDRTTVLEAIERAVQEGAAYELEFRAEQPDGNLVWVYTNGQLVRDENGVPVRMLGATVDISERKRAEEALRQNERLLQAVLDQMPSGVSIAEAPSGRLLFHNEEAVRLIGHPPIPVSDYIGYTRYGALHADGTPYAPKEYPIARALSGAVVHQEEMDYRRGDGTVTTLLVNAAPVRGGHGRIIRAVSTFQDISELKRVQEALRLLNETLEERVEERTRQVHALARQLTLAEQEERRRISQILHDDLQQVLYAIELKIDMVREDLQGTGESELIREVDGARHWIDRAVAMTRQLTVDLSPPILEREGLANALEWLQSQVRDLYGLEVTLETEHNWYIPDEDLRVLLFQIVRELLFNVQKHAGVRRATVTLAEEGGQLAIYVDDMGRGFDASTVVERSKAKSGIGLANARERLRLLGGQLEIRSDPGRGTHARITAPVKPVHLPADRDGRGTHDGG